MHTPGKVLAQGLAVAGWLLGDSAGRGLGRGPGASRSGARCPHEWPALRLTFRGICGQQPELGARPRPALRGQFPSLRRRRTWATLARRQDQNTRHGAWRDARAHTLTVTGRRATSTPVSYYLDLGCASHLACRGPWAREQACGGWARPGTPFAHHFRVPAPWGSAGSERADGGPGGPSGTPTPGGTLPRPSTVAQQLLPDRTDGGCPQLPSPATRWSTGGVG